MTSATMINGVVGIWCWQRDDVHQMISVLSAFSCSLLDFI